MITMRLVSAGSEGWLQLRFAWGFMVAVLAGSVATVMEYEELRGGCDGV